MSDAPRGNGSVRKAMDEVLEHPVVQGALVMGAGVALARKCNLAYSDAYVLGVVTFWFGNVAAIWKRP